MAMEDYMWYFEKKQISPGIKKQESIKLIHASEQQLIKFHDHARSMLTNDDKNKQGRLHVLSKVKDERSLCNVELFLRHLERVKGMTRYTLLDEIFDIVKTYDYSKYNVKDLQIIDNCADYCKIPVNKLIDGCTNSLGIFQDKHVTTNFMLRIGVWLKKEDYVELDEMYPEKTLDEKFIIKFNLPSNIRIKINPKGLSYKQFKAIMSLNKTQYHDMTDEQLLTLRNRVLFDLENMINKQVSFWNKKILELREVADYKNFNLT